MHQWETIKPPHRVQVSELAIFSKLTGVGFFFGRTGADFMVRFPGDADFFCMIWCPILISLNYPGSKFMIMTTILLDIAFCS